MEEGGLKLLRLSTMEVGWEVVGSLGLYTLEVARGGLGQVRLCYLIVPRWVLLLLLGLLELGL